MNYQDIKAFIRDFNTYARIYTAKELFSKYFLRGNFKTGFRLFFKTPYSDSYYFKLDDEDIQYLINKYTPIYEDIIEQEKQNDIRAKKATIERLTKEIQSEIKYRK